MVELVNATGGAGADVVFEVSGSGRGRVDDQAPRVRGRIVVVALFPSPRSVPILCASFGCGACVWRAGGFRGSIRRPIRRSALIA
jgi:threonine dehydrogenase-like Zn-dependent dehydrogenase